MLEISAIGPQYSSVSPSTKDSSYLISISIGRFSKEYPVGAVTSFK